MLSFSYRTLDAPLRLLLHDAQAALLDLYGPWLDQLILFGSRARGDHRPDSDVDVLVVLDDQWDGLDPAKRRALRERHAEISFDLLLKHEMLLSFIVVDRHRLIANQDPLFWNVHEEGIPIFSFRAMIESLMEQAKAYLEDAALLMEERQRVRPAMHLSYYAMFYAAKAATITQGIQAKSHSGLIQQFGLRLVSQGPIEPIYGRYLSQAFDARQAATYDLETTLSLEDAQIQLDHATQFVARIERYLSEPSTRE